MPFEFTCQHCGAPFTNRKRGTRFCSTACRDDARTVVKRIEYACAQCGATFTRHARPHANDRCRFCSRECGWAWQRDRIVPSETRFWAKIEVAGPDDCWLWVGARTRGYGVIGWGPEGAMVKAHRKMWELTHGPIPEDMYICHRCDNPQCVNPRHLYVGTPTDNNRDTVRKGHWRKRGHGVSSTGR